jgi:pimeloyl-ACP methyl ester carboxylesterase
MNATARLALFSGLGIGPELYEPQMSLPARTRARVERVPWLPTQRGEGLRSYAHRLASTIEPTGPLYLGGVSFGAMLALEAATILRPRGVFVIAGARSGKALSPLVRMTCRLSKRVAEPIFATMLLGAPLLLRMVGRPDRREREFLLRLARESIPSLTQWGCHAMQDWSAPPPADIGCPVHQIHGSDDRMIPLARLSPPPDQVIPGGGHVINITRANIVNEFIATRMQAG